MHLNGSSATSTKGKSLSMKEKHLFFGRCGNKQRSKRMRPAYWIAWKRPILRHIANSVALYVDETVSFAAPNARHMHCQLSPNGHDSEPFLC